MPNTDKFKQFVQTNHQAFDLWQLNDAEQKDLWNGIQGKLQTASDRPFEETQSGKESKRPKKFVFSRRFFQVAASLLLLAVAVLSYAQFTESPSDLAAAYPELAEAESYYQNEVNVKIKQVKAIHTETPLPEEALLEDVKKLELAYNDLKNDLKDNANNEQVVSAMIQNYRTRLLILEQLLEELQKIKNTENNIISNHETNI
ncbi:MAG: hypothetical protein EAZ57_08055 [Cytophagales bacterium]|nr:MAG: hypothetical protein EAZ67_09135 [Cytophagales bacterium]TAF60286.1 MAG: hypothetical protein EAZ57_08055 [Cytophagales bacterium]